MHVPSPGLSLFVADKEVFRARFLFAFGFFFLNPMVLGREQSVVSFFFFMADALSICKMTIFC